MKHTDKVDMIDTLLTNAIAKDIVNGTLLNTDDTTVHMLLIGIWEDLEAFTSKGIVIGEA